jgi:hypothetical protein
MTATSHPRLPTDTERHEAGDDGPSGTRLWLKVVLGVGLLAGAVLWSYALFGPRSAAPGTMDDQSFGLAAEPICARALTQVDALPLAHLTTDPTERADVLDEANALLAGQLEELAALVPLTAAGSEDRRRVEEWLADWTTYLDDRLAYPVALREDRDARFRETEKAGDHISQALEGFALKNGMPSCAPPGDIG